MSAFIVDGRTIDRIVTFILKNTREFAGIAISSNDQVTWSHGIGSQIGQILYRLNTDAVNYRYSEREESPGPRYKFKPVAALADVQAYKSIGCFLYQCSEGEFPEHPVFKQLAEVQNELAHRIVSNLSAYDKADWG